MARLVCISCSPRRLSRTARLAGRLADAVQRRIPMRRHDVALADDGLAVMSGLDRVSLSPASKSVCRTVEAADVIVVASPVCRASCTGLLKHLFDLLDRETMRSKIAILAATGSMPLHGSMLEHQLRPLMSFFAIQTAATALYGLEDEIGLDGDLAVGLRARVELAADEAVALLRARQGQHVVCEAA